MGLNVYNDHETMSTHVNTDVLGTQRSATLVKRMFSFMILFRFCFLGVLSFQNDQFGSGNYMKLHKTTNNGAEWVL